MKAAKNSKDREKEMDRVEEKWEKDFTIVGATAIEDKLQDRVGNFFLTKPK